MDLTFMTVLQWFKKNKWKAFPFQKAVWAAYKEGYSGMINAPTGSGKTYSIFLAVLQNEMSSGLKLIWITPIRALAKEIKQACDRACQAIGKDWQIAIRTGDTTPTERQKQFKNPPDVLITTPESLHVIMCKARYEEIYQNLKCVVVDEWHELIGSKRGVQTELAISRLRAIQEDLRVWGISATIANMEEAVDVLLGMEKPAKWKFIKADIQKKIELQSIYPDEIEKYPWSGHLGLNLVPKVIPIIRDSKTTLIFTNTRAQSEIWYQALLYEDPTLAGQIAMHHGSVSRVLRDWVEEALYDGKLRAVVCTSSLDLGVDFRPVETIIQIGGPKGVARFVQRAGRSGHAPGEKSKIFFLPTHALELIEAAALREGIKNQKLERRIPYIRSFDVLIQYLMTLAVSDGFSADQIFGELKKTYCYHSVTPEEWQQVLHFLVNGSMSLKAYDEYQKIGIINGVYRVKNKKIATRHKLSIGTIVSDAMINVRFKRGKNIGLIEEYFASQLKVGDVFWFAGQALEMVRLKEMNLEVRAAKKRSKKIPSYLGGRLPMSSEMSAVMRSKIHDYDAGRIDDLEMETLVPLLEQQKLSSLLPKPNELLVEYFETKEGFHLLIYPFEGRSVHEGMGAFIAQRLATNQPLSFTIAMNDYGFELLSDQEIEVEALINHELFSTKNLSVDIQASINAVELARRQFRDIARISGLIFGGYPGKQKKDRHLQASSQLIFNVFKDYESDNLLYLQTYEEVMTFKLEEARMRSTLERIQNQKIVISRPDKPTPFSFPILVDRLRETMSTEQLNDRIKKMTAD